MKRRVFKALVFIMSLAVSQSLWADSKENTTAEALISDQGKLIEEVVLLGDEITNLRNTITPIQKAIEDSKDQLKKVSSASTTARVHNRKIRELEPQLTMFSEQLTQKLQEFNAKLDQINIVETQLQWEEDSVRGSLFKTASKWFQPSEEKTP